MPELIFRSDDLRDLRQKLEWVLSDQNNRSYYGEKATLSRDLFSHNKFKERFRCLLTETWDITF